MRPSAMRARCLQPRSRVLRLLAALVALGLALLVAAPWGPPSASADEEQSAQAFASAPRLALKTWLQGEPFDPNGPGIHVVELWATWCGPCLESLPHLDALQAKHGERVRFVALSDESVGEVRAFLKRRPLAVRVAVDPGGALTKPLVEQLSAGSIPFSVLIKDGRIQWAGHPMGLEPVLEAVLDGRWRSDSLARLQAAEAAVPGYLMALSDPAREPSPELAQLGERLLEDAQLSPQLLNNVAWALLTEVPEARRPLALALRMAEAAAEATDRQDAAILDTYALALFVTGAHEQALATERQALALCRATPGEDCEAISEALARFTAAKP